MSDSTNAVPPGWYPDQSGQQRWWDGTQWTEHVQTPYSAAAAIAALKAPEGTKTGTVWIWLIVLIPLLGLSTLFFIDWADYVDSVVAASVSDPYGTGAYSQQLALYSSPGYVINNLLSFLVYGLTVLFAVLDVRELKKRGVPQPFHWAFAFLTSIVYVIGRSVVVKRRTGGGLAPLWVYIAITAVSIIVGIVFGVLLTQYMMEAMLTQMPFPVN